MRVFSSPKIESNWHDDFEHGSWGHSHGSSQPCSVLWFLCLLMVSTFQEEEAAKKREEDERDKLKSDWLNLGGQVPSEPTDWGGIQSMKQIWQGVTEALRLCGTLNVSRQQPVLHCHPGKVDPVAITKASIDSVSVLVYPTMNTIAITNPLSQSLWPNQWPHTDASFENQIYISIQKSLVIYIYHYIDQLRSLLSSLTASQFEHLWPSYYQLPYHCWVSSSQCHGCSWNWTQEFALHWPVCSSNEPRGPRWRVIQEFRLVSMVTMANSG